MYVHAHWKSFTHINFYDHGKECVGKVVKESKQKQPQGAEESTKHKAEKG